MRWKWSIHMNAISSLDGNADLALQTDTTELERPASGVERPALDSFTVDGVSCDLGGAAIVIVQAILPNNLQHKCADKSEMMSSRSAQQRQSQAVLTSVMRSSNGQTHLHKVFRSQPQM